ncbi:hypothetical protein CROQUDRAFT_51646, partial [Cronartium quercuum f. sp. fusiforme G11]
PPPLSFDDFIGGSHPVNVRADANTVAMRLHRLDKLAPTVENFARNMIKLENDGTNFNTWVEEVNATIYFLLGKSDYLNTPSNTIGEVHPDVDHAENMIAYRVLYYTLTTELRAVV